MARRLDYLVLRIVAIVMALGLTGYSAWLSWSHFGEPTGPIAAVTGAGLFVFGEYVWRDRQRLRAMLLFGLGTLALVISGTAVLHRASATEEARLQAARSTNLPRVEAAKALADAKEALAAAVAAAQGECRSGRGARCTGLEQREEAARQRVAEARAKLAGLGAQSTDDPHAAHRCSAVDFGGALPADRTSTPAHVAGADRAAASFDRVCTLPPSGGGASAETEEAQEAARS